MDAASRRRIVELYERSLQRWGPTARAARWAGEDSQRTRFDVLYDLGPWDGASVLDVGCGLGDLFGYLIGRGASVRYTGCDLSPAMIEAARRKHPQPGAGFEVRDVSRDAPAGRFDYVVASGTFNIRVKDHDAYLRRTLAVMYGACRRGMAVNVLRPVPLPEGSSEIMAWCADFYYAIEPADLLASCRQLSPDVELREGYLAGESTVFVRRPGGSS